MLLIDLGNSSIKGQWWQVDDLWSSCNIRIQPGWQQCFEAYLDGMKSKACYYSSVPGSAAQRDLLDLLLKYFNKDEVHPFVARQYCAGVTSAYQQPQRLGVDRWLALLGGYSMGVTDAMIIDAGSAITVDLLKKDGQHLGGAILPGFNTSLERFKIV